MFAVKHLIECRCVLPQYKKAANPPLHQFTVCSIVNDDNTCRTKYAQCPNCMRVHKVTEISRSEIVAGREEMASLITIDDVKCSLPESLTKILEKSDADLPTWELAQFIYVNGRWGEIVVLRQEREGNVLHGKYVRILGTNTFMVENFERGEPLL